MKSSYGEKLLSCLLSVLIVVATMPVPGALAMYQAPASGSSSSSDYTGQGAPLSAQELQSLVAPIALYPDALVAQVLNAATFPDQIAVANYWMGENKNLTGSALMQAVNQQTWDPSVKALTEFPSVLDNMAKNLSWTSQLGEAYHNQQKAVMQAVQTCRAQAKAAGNLKTTPQQTVTTQTQNGQQIIVIQPTNPQIVYVPQYNPTVVYGTPYTVPSYSTADMVTTGLLSFGAGMAVGAAMSGCCGWGYSSWTCNWYGGGAYYHGYPYYGNPAWHGGYYGGYHPYGDGYYNNAYHPDYNSNGYHTNYNGGYNASGYHPTTDSGNTYNRNTYNLNTGNSNSWNKSGWSNNDASRGWGSQDTANRNTAFSGYGDHSGSSFGNGGWGDRASSSRGWASRGGGGGWGGGRFSGGGGHFGGGGFRR
ncbi:MAG TPA: DUF3300 domain-containing protein [Candidatus Bathyarchaeia archaeon]|nr:DUF3300 domain-containing protein [Candidatus Bathyarchaeia archaeon]